MKREIELDNVSRGTDAVWI